MEKCERIMLFPKIYKVVVKISNKMACESAKCYSTAVYTTIMVVLSLQLLSTIERQVFDFLGYMWAPIIGNFFQIVCTILGIFGTYQYRPKFIAVYSTWSLIWLGWNVFVICLYLEVGVLNRNREIYILNIGTRNKSWWLEHGIGCKINNDTWVSDAAANTARKIPPEEFVEGCLLDYYYVEVIHAGVQCLLCLTGFVFTCMAIYIYGEEHESCKYKVPPSTYVSPKDYPSAHYAPIEAVQRARDSWCQPTYVSYTESMEWSKGQETGSAGSRSCDSNVNQSGSAMYGFQAGLGVACKNKTQSVVNMEDQSMVPKADNCYTDYNQTGTTRMRNYDNGTVEQSMYSSRAYNSGGLWAQNSSSGDATSANDELEFVKMHSLSSPRNNNNNSPDHTEIDMPIDTDAQSTRSRNTAVTAANTDYHSEYPTMDRPPSYETSMKNASAVNHYYATDRQSVRSVRSARSTRSTRSKMSTRSKNRIERQERREDLPWVQITPTPSNTETPQYRNFP